MRWSGIKGCQHTHTQIHMHARMREHPEQKGIVCIERVAAGQCICVHDKRLCSIAASPETTGDAALKVWAGCVFVWQGSGPLLRLPES